MMPIRDRLLGRLKKTNDQSVKDLYKKFKYFNKH